METAAAMGNRDVAAAMGNSDVPVAMGNRDVAAAMGNSDVAVAMGNLDVARPTSYGTAPRPKPPLNAYANFHRYFCGTPAYKDALKALGPTKAVGAPMQLTSKAWAELPAAEKDGWRSQAKAAKAAYNLEHYGETPKEKRVRKSSSSDSGGGAPKTPKTKFAMTETDIDIEIVTAGSWTAFKMPSGAVYVIAKQFGSEADMRTAQADKKAARKPYSRKGGAPPPPPPPSASGGSSDEDEAEEPEPEAEAEPEPARKSKRARK